MRDDDRVEVFHRPRKQAPRTIRRHGRTYEMTPWSKWDEFQDTIHAEAEAMAWPRGIDPASLSSTQKMMIQRIAACPVPIYWSGMLWRDGATTTDIAFAPHLPHRTIAVLWRKGMLVRNKKKDLITRDTIALSTRGRTHEMPGRIRYEELRWQALIECGHDMAERWAEWRRNYEQTGDTDKRPNQRPTEREIHAKLRIVYERQKAGT